MKTATLYMIVVILVAISVTRGEIETLRDALLAGGWRTQAQLDRMTLDEKRNTLIVEMSKHSNLTIPTIQGKTDKKLISMAAVCIFLRDNKFRTKDELNQMSDEDQRNTLIVELHNKLDKGIAWLQSKDNFELVRLGNSWVGKSKTVSRIESIEWHLDQGKEISRVPEILKEQIFDNCQSDNDFQSSFTYNKTVTTQTTFEHSNSINWKFGESVTFSGKIPFIADTSVGTSFELGGYRTWTYGSKNTISKAYKKSTIIKLARRSSIKRRASVTLVKIDVPYTLTIINVLGSKKIITGVWHGVSMMRARDTQFDLACQ